MLTISKSGIKGNFSFFIIFCILTFFYGAQNNLMQRNPTIGRLSQNPCSPIKPVSMACVGDKNTQFCPLGAQCSGRGTGAQGHESGGQLRGQHSREGKNVGAAGED